MESHSARSPSRSADCFAVSLLCATFCLLIGRRKPSEFIEIFALRHSPLSSFGEKFREVRRRISSNSPLVISPVRLRDAEMHRASALHTPSTSALNHH